MKKLKYILTSLLTVAMCFSVLKITANASLDYNVKTLSFTHGSVSISSGFGEDISGTLGGSQSADIYNYLSFTFDKYYSGTVTLKWTYSSSAWRQNLTDWNILVIGGKIDSNNNTSGNIVFRVYDTDNFMVIMTYNSGTLINGTDPTFAFSSASSSLTAVTNHNDLYNNVDNIDSQLSTTNTQLTGIVSLLGALQNLQNTISTNVADIEDYVSLNSDGITNTDIETSLNLITSWNQLINANIVTIRDNLATVLLNQQDANSYLANIEGEVDGVEELLTAIEGTLVVEGVSVFSQLAATQAAILAALTSQGGESIFDAINDILELFDNPLTGVTAQLTSLNNKITNTNNTLNDIKTALGNLLTAVNNIDNQIDTITWISVIPDEYSWSTSKDGEYITTAISSNQTDLWIKIKIPNLTELRNGCILKIRTGIYNNTYLGGYQDYNVELIRGNINWGEFYYDNYGGYLTLYIMNPSFNTVDYLYIHVSAPASNTKIRMGASTSNNLVYYIGNNDIEYWTLLSYFDQYNYHKKILNLLSIDVDSETSLTIYNEDNTTIDNINTGLNNEYQTYLPFVNQQLSPLSNTTFLNEMNNQRTLFDYLFRNIFNLDYNVEDPSTVTNPIFLILIFGGILLALVG